jgi:hypothetical protein
VLEEHPVEDIGVPCRSGEEDSHPIGANEDSDIEGQ